MADNNEDLYEIRSQCSSISRMSRLSSASAMAARARAKAEAAKAQASYAQKEADMLKRQAYIQEEQQKAAAEAARKTLELEANLRTLRLEGAAAAANAEAEVLEAAAESELEGDACLSCKKEPVEDKYEANSETDTHTDSKPPEPTSAPARQQGMDNSGASYVGRGNEQSSVHSEPVFQELPVYQTQQQEPVSNPRYAHAQSPLRNTRLKQEYNYNLGSSRDICRQQAEIPTTRRFSSSFQEPQHLPSATPRFPESSQSAATDVAKYLVRREMVSSGLLKFDDQPENYWAWKASFLSTTEGLNLTCREELDLLCKWLGPKSSEHARRIRAVHIHDAAGGVNMVWERLEDCYGSSEAIENALLKKVDDFPRVTSRDYHRLIELGDLLLELEAAKSDGFLPGLSYLDTSRGINPIVQKLPYNLHDKWIAQAARYKESHRSSYPPFSFFAKFVRDQAKTLNDPSFSSLMGASNAVKTEKIFKSSMRTPVSARKTEIFTPEGNQSSSAGQRQTDPEKQCPLHQKPHPLRKCRGFRSKSLDERKAYLKEKNICFKCCASFTHLAKDCDKNVVCRECKSDRHTAALHPGPPPWKLDTLETLRNQGGEQEESSDMTVTSKCTDICGSSFKSRSCAKICLVKVYPAGQEEKAVETYVVLDEQSNKSLARTEFFELFNLNNAAAPYSLKTCSGVVETQGRRANSFMMASLDGKTHIQLPTLIECDMLPDDRSEIPTPEITKHYPHLKRVGGKIPALNPDAGILILLGRDIPRAHKVRDQCNGPHNAPYAQRLDLGWVIIGEVCLGKAHRSENVNVYRTNVLSNGRTSLFDPCTNSFSLKEKVTESIPHHHFLNVGDTTDLFVETDSLGKGVFQRTTNDDKPAMSVEDKDFMQIMDKEAFIDETNSWVAPLPFKNPRPRLPNNRSQAVKRFTTLCRTLGKRSDMKEHMLTFMRKIFEAGHAELAPPLTAQEECWYLPIFGVYHPRKPGQVRAVFDSSAKHDGVSLNDVLLSGPDLNNTLLGVLTRFRKEPVAVAADIEQMFYCFKVQEEHRNFLRFLWFEDNDPCKDFCEYRMTVHVFGNSPSPAVAIYGLKRTALEGNEEHGNDAKQFVLRNFYVDDGLASFPTDEVAIKVLKNAKDMLADCNILLHKISSNQIAVMEAFPPEERAKELKNLELSADPLPLQRSLGLVWNLQTDSFTFQVSREEKPFTRRGILSTVNSLFDPLGLVAPITVQGKALIREFCTENWEWDTPLSTDKAEQWKCWRDSLLSLESLQIPRSYLPVSLLSTNYRELCVFCDASTAGIAAVAYLRTVSEEGQVHVGFVMAKSKLAPRHTHTVPRLELCAAVLAVELAEMLQVELDIVIQAVKFYTDSRVVLGYISNTSRRFYVYVANRVARIRKSTHPEQWHYVSSEQNPADHGTRPVHASLLEDTNWFTGPSFLMEHEEASSSTAENFALVEPDCDADVRPLVATFAVTTSELQLGSKRFERFSSWKLLIYGLAALIHKMRSFSKVKEQVTKSTDQFVQAKTVVIRSIQQEAFRDEIQSLSHAEIISRHSSLRKLDPFQDKDGLLRVGGRMSASGICWEEKYPIIIPKGHIATLLVRYYHERAAHQGRHITEGTIRSAGLWILGGKKLVSSILHKCVICRRLRGTLEKQKMSDLPSDRLTQAPPFTHVGLDVFGPWTVCARRTRGGLSESKRWAVMFTCLVTRAVHLEVIESLSTSSFINALRRFLAIRGPAKLFRSDCGTNFVGACNELGITSDNPELQSYLKEQSCTWKFNVPHASHMGGVWERMIGIARRILDGLLLQVHAPGLSHEVLVTLMAEVAAIMNGRPIVPVSSDPDMPTVLTPAMLLTQKVNSLSAPSVDLDLKDIYRSQWKQVQGLADSFWTRWRHEYLVTLQPRRKWQTEQPDLQVGDVVLLKDNQVKRNEWPTGLITKTFPGQDNKVRKVEVRVVKDGSPKVYLRPISEVVLLLKGT